MKMDVVGGQGDNYVSAPFGIGTYLFPCILPHPLSYPMHTYNVSYIMVRLLLVWVNTQKFYIQWGDTSSDAFCVNNGVSEGGIVSPMLFNGFNNELSVALNCLANLF